MYSIHGKCLRKKLFYYCLQFTDKPQTGLQWSTGDAPESPDVLENKYFLTFSSGMWNLELVARTVLAETRLSFSKDWQLTLSRGTEINQNSVMLVLLTCDSSLWLRMSPVMNSTGRTLTSCWLYPWFADYSVWAD